MEEFSDESLFGEDHIEDLIDKITSFQRTSGANNNNLQGMTESFRGRGLNLMRMQ